MKIILTSIFVFLKIIVVSASGLPLVEEIFTKLTTAVGDYRSELPRLEIRSSKGQVATYSRLTNTIYIEQAALDICNQFNENESSAIAFLLAHELTHFYQKHDWQEAGFATSFLTKSNTFAQHIGDEQEADTYGAFLSYLAGYQTINIIPKLLDVIYQDYVLNDANLTAYPPLATRKNVANKTCERVTELIKVYEAGNYLFALNQLEEAYYCYNYVAKFIRCKEVYNNLGATALYAATLLTDYNQLQFVYPIALDPQLPLRTPAALTKKELLNTATINLSLATQYDPTYYTAFINLACAYELQQNEKAITALIQQLQNLPLTKKEQAQVLILQGILAARKANKTAAKQYFQQAKNLYDDLFIKELVKYNERILAGKKIPTSEFTPPVFISDQIDGYNLLTSTPSVMQSLPLGNDGITDILLQMSQTTNGDYFQINNVKLLIVNNLNLKTSKSVGKDSNISVLIKQYKNTSNSIKTSGDYWVVCPSNGLIFELEKDLEKVQKWGIFVVQ